MLALTCQRAGIRDGMSVLDLGCGWGSLALYVAEHFPASRVLAVSNSRSQGEYIRAEAARRGLANVEHRAGNIADIEIEETFDRVVSIEMLEHVRNYEAAFHRIRRWLAPGGRVFVHVFANDRFAYTFDAGPDDWMGRTFFTGGTMPADDLFLEFREELRVIDHWRMDGTHYAKTLEAWLATFDRERATIQPILEATYGRAAASRWRARWRLFLLASAEAFGYDDGQRWGVSHYLLAPADPPSASAEAAG